MAIVKMKQIKSTLHKAIVYITDPGKTENGSLVSTNYTDATDSPTLMADAMLRSIDMTAGGRRTNGVLAHHVIHSLSPEDGRRVSARQTHEIGIAFADEITKGEYQYVIATHVDRDHLHNHIIICAANAVTRRKMRVRKDTLAGWRAISDRLCKERGLNVLTERRSRRHGVSLAELYASAKGDAIKDRMRLAIDTAAGIASDFDSFSRALRREGVTVTVRGRRLTFADVSSGMRVKDVRLGRAYDELNIMARIGRHTVMPITFNRRMIAAKEDGRIRIWLPNTGRRLSIVIPLTQIVRDGDTYRAYLPSSSQQVLTDLEGRYVRRIDANGLYEWFSKPRIRLEPVRHDRPPTQIGMSEQQRRWYAMQSKRLDELDRLVNALNTTGRLRSRDIAVDDAIADVTARIEAESERFQTLLVAACDATEATHDSEAQSTGYAPPEDLTGELRECEQRLDRLAVELDTLRRVRDHAQQAKQRMRVRNPE